MGAGGRECDRGWGFKTRPKTAPGVRLHTVSSLLDLASHAKAVGSMKSFVNSTDFTSEKLCQDTCHPLHGILPSSLKAETLSLICD